MTVSEVKQVARVQMPAPHFEGKAVVKGEFEDISLNKYAGKWVLLFFYPMGIFLTLLTIKMWSLQEPAVKGRISIQRTLKI